MNMSTSTCAISAFHYIRYVFTKACSVIRTLVLVLAITVLVGCQSTLPQSKFAAQPPRIPAPAGFVDGTGLSKQLKTMDVAVTPPGATLLGQFYPTNMLAELLAARSTGFSPYCRAFLLLEFASVSEATEGFAKLVADAKAQERGPVNLEDPDFKEAARRLEKQGIVTTGAAALGSFLVTPTVWAASMLATNKGQIMDKPQTEVPWVYSFAFIRLGRQLLTLGVSYPFQSPADVAASKKTLLGWVREIEKQNVAE
jgi:hypothetical protein